MSSTYQEHVQELLGADMLPTSGSSVNAQTDATAQQKLLKAATIMRKNTQRKEAGQTKESRLKEEEMLRMAEEDEMESMEKTMLELVETSETEEEEDNKNR